MIDLELQRQSVHQPDQLGLHPFLEQLDLVYEEIKTV